jgi:hypothetical protein
MMLRRLIAWFRRSRLPRSQKAPQAANDCAAFDLNEFGRLLNSGKTEDLQKIANTLGGGKTSGLSREYQVARSRL